MKGVKLGPWTYFHGVHSRYIGDSIQSLQVVVPNPECGLYGHMYRIRPDMGDATAFMVAQRTLSVAGHKRAATKWAREWLGKSLRNGEGA